jgi:hypothetical protein
VALTAALAVTTGATAARKHHPAKGARLARTVRHLRKELKSAGAALATADASLTTAQAGLTTATAEEASLRSELATETALAAKYKAGIPDPLQVAVTDVQREVIDAQGGETGSYDPQLVAEAAMDYTYGHVRSAVFGYFEDLYDEGPTGPDMLSYTAPVETILADQEGICVHHERVFAAIVEAFGLPVRDVGFDYIKANGDHESHSTAEVYYSGGWHFFDPTFGVLYEDAAGDVLSIADARSGADTVTTVKDDAGFQNLLNPDSTSFELDPATSVTYVTQPA